MSMIGRVESRMFGSTILISSFLLLMACLPFITSTTINTASMVDVSVGRNLLQAKQACPVNFESLDYTNLTSSCRGPSYPAKACCDAFKIIACPYAEYLNDASSDCATTLFSYINLHGNYPPGLFSSECKDSKRGLECPPNIERVSVDGSSGSSRRGLPLLLMISSIFVGFVLQLF